MRWGRNRSDRALALGLAGGAVGLLLASLSRSSKFAEVDGVMVQRRPKRPMRPTQEAPQTEGAGAKTPTVPTDAAPWVAVVNDNCELPTGPFRFKRDETKGELREDLMRLAAGSEPFAVRIKYTDATIREMAGGEPRAYRGGIDSLRDPQTGEPWVLKLPFAPPGQATTDKERVGYVLSRVRRSYKPSEALSVCEQAIGGVPDTARLPACAARLATAGLVTVSWEVAQWRPQTCDYVMVRLQGAPGVDAMKNRL